MRPPRIRILVMHTGIRESECEFVCFSYDQQRRELCNIQCTSCCPRVQVFFRCFVILICFESCQGCIVTVSLQNFHLQS